MILVAMNFANNFLNMRMAENEFSANKQFMLTTGLQIDDIAWTIGRTQTVRYSSQFGSIKFQSPALTYSFEVHYTGGAVGDWEHVFSNDTGMVLFNMPVSIYSVGNNYFNRISPSNGSFLQIGPSAPVSHVFCVEKLPMNEGNYTRIAVVSSIRMLSSSISGGQQAPTYYYKFYLPTLERGASPYLSQSVTMTGSNLTKIVRSGVDQVRITVSFPNAGLGFDSSFFNFDHLTETQTLPQNSVVEFYLGKVIVSLGQV